MKSVWLAVKASKLNFFSNQKMPTCVTGPNQTNSKAKGKITIRRIMEFLMTTKTTRL